MGIEYRMLDPNSPFDIQQWRDLYSHSFFEPISENEWRWKYIQNPFGDEKRSLTYVVLSDDSIIGSLSLLPMQFCLHTRHKKEILPAGLVTNAMVHSDFRNRGIFSKLLSLAMEDATADGFKVLYTYAINAFSYQGFLRHNWREVPGFKRYDFYLNFQQTLRNVLKTTHVPASLKSILNLVPAEPIRFRHYRKEKARFQFSCGKVEDLLTDIEHLHKGYLAENRISGVRKLESLQWFFGYPENNYLCFSMRAENELLAYCIVRQQKSYDTSLHKIAIIEDSFSQREKSSLDSRLLSYMIEQLSKCHFTKISTSFFRKGLLASISLYNGFISYPDYTRFLYYPLQRGSLSDDCWNRIIWDVQMTERTPF